MAAYVRGQQHFALARDIDDYLADDANGVRYNSTEYMDLMAESVGEEIHRGGVLRLGRIVGQSQVQALFFSRPHESQHHGKSFVFTSWSAPADTLEKFVSIEVQTGNNGNDCTRLYTGSWLNGLWYCNRSSRKRFIFPWSFSQNDGLSNSYDGSNTLTKRSLDYD